jgi:hypothetical protein
LGYDDCSAGTDAATTQRPKQLVNAEVESLELESALKMDCLETVQLSDGGSRDRAALAFSF